MKKTKLMKWKKSKKSGNVRKMNQKWNSTCHRATRAPHVCSRCRLKDPARPLMKTAAIRMLAHLRPQEEAGTAAKTGRRTPTTAKVREMRWITAVVVPQSLKVQRKSEESEVRVKVDGSAEKHPVCFISGNKDKNRCKKSFGSKETRRPAARRSNRRDNKEASKPSVRRLRWFHAVRRDGGVVAFEPKMAKQRKADLKDPT